LALADGYKNVLIPIDQYAGSKERSKSEQGKTHLLSPLLKKLDKAKLAAMNSARTKKGNVSAKQKAMATKFKFSEGTLNENPDGVGLETLNLQPFDRDAFAFGQYAGKMHIGYLKTHGGMLDKDWPRKKYAYPGRLWSMRKVMSFWKYPSLAQMKKLTKEINAAAKENDWPLKIDNT